MSIKVLLIDDEPMMKRMLADVFCPPEFEFLAASDGREGLQQIYNWRPDVVLLDIMMPGMSGWEVCQRIREFSAVPIIMLTAMGQTTDRVRGLDLGADDYITKPVALEEIKARVKALLRRVALGEQTACLYSAGGDFITVDPIARRVRVAGEEISLTPTEYNLLLYFITHPDRPISYGELLDNVWGPGYEAAMSNLKLYVLYLRRKIEPDPDNPIYIVNERGVGYRFVRSPQQES